MWIQYFAISFSNSAQVSPFTNSPPFASQQFSQFDLQSSTSFLNTHAIVYISRWRSIHPHRCRYIDTDIVVLFCVSGILQNVLCWNFALFFRCHMSLDLFLYSYSFFTGALRISVPWVIYFIDGHWSCCSDLCEKQCCREGCCPRGFVCMCKNVYWMYS